MKKVKLFLGILSVLGILFATACQDLDNTNDQQGNLVIKLTDAPFPIDMIEAATVNITKVEVRKVTDGEEDGYPYITVLGESKDFNLLDLRDGITADLVDTVIEAGDYDLIRVHVDQAGLVVIGKEPYKLKVPSGPQTGIKIFMEPELHVAGGLTTDVLLDFNLEKSFILKGNLDSPAGIKGFNFKPVIRAVNNTTDGTVEGMVTNSDTALENAYVLMEQVVGLDTFEISSASADEEGYYAMPEILAGFYNLSATLAGFDTVTFEGVEVVEGNLTVQNFILTKL